MTNDSDFNGLPVRLHGTVGKQTKSLRGFYLKSKENKQILVEIKYLMPFPDEGAEINITGILKRTSYGATSLEMRTEDTWNDNSAIKHSSDSRHNGYDPIK